MLNEQQSKKLRELFAQGEALSPDERATFLRRACGSDQQLLAEVNALFDARESASPLDSAIPLQSYLAQTGQVVVGQLLNDRYEILGFLGEGGMGAVFKAQDRWLKLPVALKVIRPELAGSPDAIERFKEELVVARRIAHRNVVKTYDFDLSGDLKFITMEYIEGENLTLLLGPGQPLSPQSAVNIIRQAFEGLQATHLEDIIHRDISPENIMLATNDRVVVMDFGIARSQLDAGKTQAGVVPGKLDYMSPEQIEGNPLDGRTDIFSLGIVFYQLLTGQSPFRAPNPLAAIVRRSKGAKTSPHELVSSVPVALSRIVMKCLEADTNSRYQTAAEVLADLERWQIALTAGPWQRWKNFSSGWTNAPVGVTCAAVLAVSLVGWSMWKGHTSIGTALVRPVSVLVADFDNGTGSSVPQGTVEQVVCFSFVDGTTSVNCLDRAQAHSIGTNIKHGAERLDRELALLVARQQSVDVVMTGSIRQRGEGFAIEATAFDAVTEKEIWHHSAVVRKGSGVIGEATRIGVDLGRALGDKTPESVNLATQEGFTTASLEAAHEYERGQNEQFQTNYEAALSHYLAAIRLDADFGRAYAGAATMYFNLRQQDQAEEYFNKALAHRSRFSDRENHRTRGGYYIATGDYEHAVEEYSLLAKKYPGDTAGFSNLALAHFYLHDLSAAADEGGKAVQLFPKEINFRVNLALYGMYASRFDVSLSEANQAIAQKKDAVKAYLALALSDLANGSSDLAKSDYVRLGQISPRGASLSSEGLADLAVYEGRLADAQGILESSIQQDAEHRDMVSEAAKLIMLAEIALHRHQRSTAMEIARRALDTHHKDIRVLASAARIYREADKEPLAQEIAAELSAEPFLEAQVHVKLIKGEIALHRNRWMEALGLFQAAQKMGDTWQGRLDLARAYAAAGMGPQAETELDQAIARRGEATCLFMDDRPTYRYVSQIQEIRSQIAHR